MRNRRNVRSAPKQFELRPKAINLVARDTHRLGQPEKKFLLYMISEFINWRDSATHKLSLSVSNAFSFSRWTRPSRYWHKVAVEKKEEIKGDEKQNKKKISQEPTPFRDIKLKFKWGPFLFKFEQIVWQIKIVVYLINSFFVLCAFCSAAENVVWWISNGGDDGWHRDRRAQGFIHTRQCGNCGDSSLSPPRPIGVCLSLVPPLNDGTAAIISTTLWPVHTFSHSPLVRLCVCRFESPMHACLLCEPMPSAIDIEGNTAVKPHSFRYIHLRHKYLFALAGDSPNRRPTTTVQCAQCHNVRFVRQANHYHISIIICFHCWRNAHHQSGNFCMCI